MPGGTPEAAAVSFLRQPRRKPRCQVIRLAVISTRSGLFASCAETAPSTQVQRIPQEPAGETPAEDAVQTGDAAAKEAAARRQGGESSFRRRHFVRAGRQRPGQHLVYICHRACLSTPSLPTGIRARAVAGHGAPAGHTLEVLLHPDNLCHPSPYLASWVPAKKPFAAGDVVACWQAAAAASCRKKLAGGVGRHSQILACSPQTPPQLLRAKLWDELALKGLQCWRLKARGKLALKATVAGAALRTCTEWRRTRKHHAADVQGSLHQAEDPEEQAVGRGIPRGLWLWADEALG
jgi:hypothetical protein